MNNNHLSKIEPGLLNTFLVMIAGELMILVNSCTKDTAPTTFPSLTTKNGSDITNTSAISGGVVTNDGGSPVIYRGVCWSMFSNPTISGLYTSDSSGTDSFTSNLNGLVENTLYYVRAYATNGTGTGYGNQVYFSTTGSAGEKPCPGIPAITDLRDGQVYPTVQIGEQCWLKKNTNYCTEDSWCYANNPANCYTYGRLYNWNTALIVCPSGWHLPSDQEWTMLTTHLSGEFIAGEKMKSTTGWNDNGNGTNSCGFTAVPGGGCYRNGSFNGLHGRAYFWSSTETSTTHAWNRHLYFDRQSVSRDNYDKTHGFSVRCLKD